MIAGYATSRHLLEDRADRLISIATTVGFGEITYKRKLTKGIGWAVFTDTGVMLVTDIHDSFIVTMYLVSIKQATAIFQGEIPVDLFDAIKRNQKKGYINS